MFLKYYCVYLKFKNNLILYINFKVSKNNFILLLLSPLSPSGNSENFFLEFKGLYHCDGRFFRVIFRN